MYLAKYLKILDLGVDSVLAKDLYFRLTTDPGPSPVIGRRSRLSRKGGPFYYLGQRTIPILGPPVRLLAAAYRFRLSRVLSPFLPCTSLYC